MQSSVLEQKQLHLTMNRTIVYREKKLAYSISGTGPVVVLLHGFGEDGRVWNYQKEHLENEFTVLVPHLPGSGSSDMIEDMSMEGMAESIRSILNAENVLNCRMIGHSMGGYITLAFAQNYPSLLTGFGLFHSTAFADTEDKKATRRKGIEMIREYGPSEFIKNTIPNLYGSYTKEHASSIIEEHIKEAGYFSAESLIAYYEAMMQRPDRSSILKQNKIPVLFVLGKYDTTVPLEQGLQQTHLPHISYIHILEGSGHMGMREEQEKSVIIIKNFLLKTV